MRAAEQYEGWSNWETWIANLLISNDQPWPVGTRSGSPVSRSAPEDED